MLPADLELRLRSGTPPEESARLVPGRRITALFGDFQAPGRAHYQDQRSSTRGPTRPARGLVSNEPPWELPNPALLIVCAGAGSSKTGVLTHTGIALSPTPPLCRIPRHHLHQQGLAGEMKNASRGARRPQVLAPYGAFHGAFICGVEAGPAVVISSTAGGWRLPGPKQSAGIWILD